MKKGLLVLTICNMILMNYFAINVNAVENVLQPRGCINDMGQPCDGLNAGDCHYLINTKLYASSTANPEARTITGYYYIWSSTVVNGRVRITNSLSNVGVPNQITGWINASRFLTLR